MTETIQSTAINETVHLPTFIPSGEAQIQWLPISQLVASPLNPRKTFDPAALRELADNIRVSGVRQNLEGRPFAEDSTLVEVIAGGRRLRAVQMLLDDGVISPDYPVPVRVQELSDREAMQIATAENVQRRNMSPVEEARAFAKMFELGDTPEEISKRFGYTLRLVHSRLEIAWKLFPAATTALEEGKITLGQAEALAQCGSEEFQDTLLKQAAYHRHSGADILRALNSGVFPVANARFPIEKYTALGGSITSGLLNDVPEHFTNKKLALELQMAIVDGWVAGKRSELQEGISKKSKKKKPSHRFVEVVLDSYPRNWPSYNNPDYVTVYDHQSEEHKALRGLVYIIDSNTGEITTTDRAARRSEIKALEKQKTQSSTNATGGEAAEKAPITKAVMGQIHELKTGALREALCKNPRSALIVSIISMTLSSNRNDAGLNLYPNQDNAAGSTSELVRMLQDFAASVTHNGKQDGKQVFLATQHYLSLAMTPTDAYDALDAQSDTVIMQAWALCSQHSTVFWNRFYPERPTAPLHNHLASALQIDMAGHFVLTEEHLKGYSKDALSDLAADAGIQDLVGQADKKSERIGVFLAQADRLAERGWIPPIAKFQSK